MLVKDTAEQRKFKLRVVDGALAGCDLNQTGLLRSCQRPRPVVPINASIDKGIANRCMQFSKENLCKQRFAAT